MLVKKSKVENKPLSGLPSVSFGSVRCSADRFHDPEEGGLLFRSDRRFDRYLISPGRQWPTLCPYWLPYVSGIPRWHITKIAASFVCESGDRILKSRSIVVVFIEPVSRGLYKTKGGVPVFAKYLGAQVSHYNK